MKTRALFAALRVYLVYLNVAARLLRNYRPA